MKRVIDITGAEISVQSEVGKESSFAFEVTRWRMISVILVMVKLFWLWYYFDRAMVRGQGWKRKMIRRSVRRCVPAEPKSEEKR